jgi:hypothetical protein
VADPARGAPQRAASSVAGPAAASGDLVSRLGSGDLGEVERAVAAIAELSAGRADPDVVFAAARACEDKLLDPGRALAIYQRIVADHPDARVAIAAARRAAVLRALVGPHGEAAALARELAQLIARADAEPADRVIQTGDALAAAGWPGAPQAALWLADWLRRTGRLGDAQARYAALVARWPALPQGQAALRGGAGTALDARDWALAERLAHQLADADPALRAARDELLAAAALGRRRDRHLLWAWLAIAAAFAAALGSLAESIARGPPGRRWSALRPPIEVAFLGPVAAVLIGVAFTAHRLIAPAVATIAAGGLALAWLSGAALERLRATGRSAPLRSAGHVLACLTGIAGLVYVALTHGGLLDMLIETVRFGPEP